jgi:hypothetical protein
MASCRPAVSAVGACAAAVDYRSRVVAQRAAVKFFLRSGYDRSSAYIFDRFIDVIVFHVYILLLFNIRIRRIESILFINISQRVKYL